MFRRIRKPHTEPGTFDLCRLVPSMERRQQRLRSMPCLRGPCEDDTDQADKPPAPFTLEPRTQEGDERLLNRHSTKRHSLALPRLPFVPFAFPPFLLLLLSHPALFLGLHKLRA